jgi:uncharacterized protein YuzE
MATRTIKGTLDTFSVSGGSEITYLGNTSAGSTGGLPFRGFRVNPTTTGDIKVEVLSSSGVIGMEIFQEDAYTTGTAPSGYLKSSNIAKNGKGKGAVGVTVTNAAKDYVVLLELDGYSEVNYSIKVDVP